MRLQSASYLIDCIFKMAALFGWHTVLACCLDACLELSTDDPGIELSNNGDFSVDKF